MRVVVVADAGQQIGSGHVMRSLAIAEEFAARGANIHWIADVDEITWVSEEIRHNAWSCSPARGGDIVGKVTMHSPDVLLIDSYTLAVEAVERMAATKAVVAGVVDPTTPEYRFDVCIDPGSLARRRRSLCATVLSGPEHTLIRRQLRDLKARGPVVRDRRRSRIVCLLGGTDASNASEPVLDVLRRLGRDIDVMLIPGDPEDNASTEPAGSALRVARLAASPSALEVVMDSDLVITTASGLGREVAFLEVPAALLVVAANQEDNYRQLLGHGWLEGLGTIDSIRRHPHETAELIRSLLDEPYKPPSPSPIDGYGAARVVDAIVAVRAARQSTVR